MEQIYDIILGNQLAGKRGEKRREETMEAIGYYEFIYEMESVERNREVIEHDIVLCSYIIRFLQMQQEHIFGKNIKAVRKNCCIFIKAHHLHINIFGK